MALAASNKRAATSAAEGAATDPRTSIVGCAWSVATTTNILYDATSNVVALSLNGSGKVGFADGTTVEIAGPTLGLATGANVVLKDGDDVGACELLSIGPILRVKKKPSKSHHVNAMALSNRR